VSDRPIWGCGVVVVGLRDRDDSEVLGTLEYDSLGWSTIRTADGYDQGLVPSRTVRFATEEETRRFRHQVAGRVCGRDATCGTKVDYKSEATAAKVADKLNAKGNRRNVLEPYPCYFCEGYHIGRKMSEDELLALGRMNPQDVALLRVTLDNGDPV
jgi:hypothetical protein